jgi:hypothetical protein
MRNIMHDYLAQQSEALEDNGSPAAKFFPEKRVAVG